MIGFKPTPVNRQPIYGNRTVGKIGYTERDAQGREWFCNTDGRRVAKVLRYKPYQAPQPTANLCGGTIVSPWISEEVAR